jgi:hypothetical protein
MPYSSLTSHRSVVDQLSWYGAGSSFVSAFSLLFRVGRSPGVNSLLHDTGRLGYGRHVLCVPLNVLHL